MVRYLFRNDILGRFRARRYAVKKRFAVAVNIFFISITAHASEGLECNAVFVDGSAFVDAQGRLSVLTPEPETILLLGIGLIIIGLALRKWL